MYVRPVSKAKCGVSLVILCILGDVVDDDDDEDDEDYGDGG